MIKFLKWQLKPKTLTYYLMQLIILEILVQYFKVIYLVLRQCIRNLEYEQDVCNLHILNWPDFDLFGVLNERGVIPSMILNRIKNKIKIHANKMLVQSL